MTFNRIAIYGHRGWASSVITKALIASGAPIKVLYRSSSDISDLPSNVEKVEVDVEDQATLISALQDIDIVISLVGHEGVDRQQHLVTAISKTNVKLFVPSDLAARYDEQGLRVPVNKKKDDVEKAAKAAGIPVTIVLVGNFAEFSLNTVAMGVDRASNRLLFYGNAANEKLNLCTREYVGAAYASIFASRPIDEIKGRIIGLWELKATGKEIAAVLAKDKGSAPQEVHFPIEVVNEKVETCLANGVPFALAHYCRKIWGTGQQARMVGDDIWEVPGYKKVSLEELIVGGKLQSYRVMPPIVYTTLVAAFDE
ncbi:hypothetical protein AAFC00_002376 [Neodothiora populina]|uniref:NmrA-like domain-containing protein n=1 Tax=Neodothiora populina TaxID=2781224 RepID=A0ABR3PH83_9PEZI